MQGAAQACQQQGLGFLPVAVETVGGFHVAAVEQVKRIGAALARHQGKPVSPDSNEFPENFRKGGRGSFPI